MKNKETLEEAAERIYQEDFNTPYLEEVRRKNIKDAMIKLANWQQEQDSWKTVSEKTPPSNVELLVKSPEGTVHLSSWREYYNIFSCQSKSESSVNWKWKII